jgi:bromodomain and WD repeat domain-containing protein 1/3
MSPNFPNSKFLCYKISWDNKNKESLSPWDIEIIPDAFGKSEKSSVGIGRDVDVEKRYSVICIYVLFSGTEIPEGAKDDGILASEEDQRSGLYEVAPIDWPPHGHQEAECDRISNSLGHVMTLGIAEPFLTPVDLNSYPEYAYSIEYPIDLSTIKTRLDNRFYRRLEALKFDVKHIALNAESFNRPRTDIVKKARIIRDLVIKISMYARFFS